MKTNLNRKGFCLLFSLFLLAGGGGLYASDYHSMSQVQDNVISVSGTVKDTKGEPLIGVSVLVKGTTNGTVTDLDGKFTLKVSAGDILEFSYIGYASQSVTVTNANSLNITLSEDTQALDEVVVTALGIKREEKALSYNVQQVNADKLNAVKDVNFINSMVGKVAGVQINSGASGPGSATRVVMRGMKSIEKDNGVLYVIDGVPMYNKSFGGSGGTMTKMVGSESAADINSDDIESVNMLTGPSAAALYGSDAANGVIIINTKKGSAEKTTVTINNSTTFSTVYMMPQMQSRYGRSDGYMNWGEQLPSDYNYDPRKFFDTGSDVINSISLSTGNKKSQTYVSFATTNSKGIVPESSYNRYNFTARNTSKFANDKLILDMGGSVIIQNDHNLVAQGTYNNPIPGLYLFPRGEDFNEVRTYERWNPTGIMTQYWPYT
ncbi:TonB-dependent receptor plug domain-containing protein, partial [Bacteroides finegoldii]